MRGGVVGECWGEHAGYGEEMDEWVHDVIAEKKMAIKNCAGIMGRDRISLKQIPSIALEWPLSLG